MKKRHKPRHQVIKKLSKKPKFECRFCGEPAVFDVKDEISGRLMGLMCERCCFNFFEYGAAVLHD